MQGAHTAGIVPGTCADTAGPLPYGAVHTRRYALRRVCPVDAALSPASLQPSLSRESRHAATRSPVGRRESVLQEPVLVHSGAEGASLQFRVRPAEGTVVPQSFVRNPLR